MKLGVPLLAVYLSSLSSYHELLVEGLAAPTEVIAPLAQKSIQSNKRRKMKKYNDSKRRQPSLLRGNDPLLSLNLNLDSLAKSGQDGSAPRAQEMLQRIQALHKEGYYAAAPDTVSFNSVLNAWARADDDDAAQKATALLKTMQDELGRVQPSIVSFNTVILVLANNGKPQQAEALLRSMQNDPNKQLRPDTITYNTVAHGWAQSRQKGSAQKAEDLLREMMALSHDGNSDVKPDTVAFNTVLHAWAVSYAPRAAKRAEELLQHMLRLYKAGNDDVEPDVYSYTSVIRAWATSRDKMAANKAMKLLEKLEKLAEEPGKEHLKPNFVTYTSVMSALAKSKKKGRALESERLLNHMIVRYENGDKSVKPDVVSFSSVMDGWAREATASSGEKALILLERMKCLHQEGHADMKPNARTYTSVIAALGKSRQGGAAEKGEQLLNEMEEEFKLGERELEPVTITYNAVLDAYGRGPNLLKAQEANTLVMKMEGSERPNMQPDTISYNSVLYACANSFGSPDIKKEAFEIAMQTFKKLMKDKQLNATSITFSLFFKVLRRLVPPGKARESMLKKTFGLCCDAGMLNNAVWGQITGACSEEEVKALLSGTPLAEVPSGVSKLPRLWTCNAGRW